MEFLDTLKKTENLISLNKNILEDESKELLNEFSLESSEKLQLALKHSKEENRLLKIGILGRVKAGKSSLINALLFEGKDILPTAATPMTAVLCTISYAEEFCAEVELYTKEDIAIFRKKYEEYEKKRQQLTKIQFLKFKEKNQKSNSRTEKELKEAAEKNAERELKAEKYEALKATYMQYKEIEKSPETINLINSNINASNLNELKGKLLKYVGADGAYMPFTKSVNIKLPQKNLKDIELIDTPGLNDPIISREARTRELLAFCDVVFIVSPSGQFISQEDTDLMDRLSSKQGLRELYVVVSKIDSQLNNIEDKKMNDFAEALESLKEKYIKHLRNTVRSLKEDNPIIDDAYDSLIDDTENRLFYSSGICTSIKNSLENNEKLKQNEGAGFYYHSLAKRYPNSFDSEDKETNLRSLELLGNIPKLKSCIKSIREKKDEILEKKNKKLLLAKQESFKKYTLELLDFINSRIEELNKGQEEELKKKEKLSEIKEKLSEGLESAYSDFQNDYPVHLKKSMDYILNENIKKIHKSQDDARDSKAVTIQEKTSEWSWSWDFWNPTYKNSTKIVNTIRTGAVASEIMRVQDNIGNDIGCKVIEEKKAYREKLIKDLEVHFEEQDQISDKQVKSNIVKITNNLFNQDFSYKKNIPSELQGQGVLELESNEGENYLKNLSKYTSSLQEEFRDDIANCIKTIKTNLERNIGEDFFNSYNKELDNLTELLRDKEENINKLNKIDKALNRIIKENNES